MPSSLRLGALPLAFSLSLAILASPARAEVLSLVQTLRDGAGGVDGIAGAYDVTFTGDGNHVYVTGYFDDAVAIFSRSSDGTLAFSGARFDGAGERLAGASALVHLDSHDVLLVASYVDDALVRMGRNPETGALTYQAHFADGVGGVDGLDGAGDVVVAPDGSLVFVSGHLDDAVAVFFAGGLVYHSTVVDGVDGVDGLDGASGMALSPDGEHLYVAGAFEDEIAVFEVGTPLVYRGRVPTAAAGCQAPVSLAVDGAGLRIYVACRHTGSIAVFQRNPQSGGLTLLETHRDGHGGVEGLAGAAAVAISPNGSWVAAVGYDDDAAALFARDPLTGRLTFHDHLATPALDGPVAAAWSPEGGSLAVAGLWSDTLAILRPALFLDGFESGNVAGWSSSAP